MGRGGGIVIHGVVVEPLRQIEDPRGKVMHMLRIDSPLFKRFGEIYFSTVNPGTVKAWKLHREMTLNLAVPFGSIKVALFDSREDSPTRGEVQTVILGERNYSLLQIPPGIWNGFQGLASTPSIIANCATLPHDPVEIERLDADDPSIPYTWDGEILP